MTLREFPLTRVVELALHGLDLANALSTPAWTTPTAAAAVTDFLGVDTAATRLGWDRTTALANATLREKFRDIAPAEPASSADS